MAKFGLTGFWAGKYSEDSSKKTMTIQNGKKIAKAVSFAPTAKVSEASLYADNGLSEHIKAITEFDLSLTPNGCTLDIDELTGVESSNITVNDKEIEVQTIGVNNVGEFTAIGIIISDSTNDAISYNVEIYPKCQFTPSTDAQSDTQGESTSFVTAAITGKAYQDVNSNYKWIKKGFTTEREAEAFIESIFFSTSLTETSN
jgi:hypothetical protein